MRKQPHSPILLAPVTDFTLCPTQEQHRLLREDCFPRTAEQCAVRPKLFSCDAAFLRSSFRLSDGSSESFTATPIAALQNPPKECNNLFLTVKMGGSPLQALSLRLNTCQTSGLGSRLAALLQWVDTLLDSYYQQGGWSPFLPPLTPSKNSSCSLKEHTSLSERLRYHKKKLRAQHGPMESRERLQQAAWDTCPRMHSS